MARVVLVGKIYTAFKHIDFSFCMMNVHMEDVRGLERKENNLNFFLFNQFLNS